MIVSLHEIIQTKKAHPCGSDQWEVVRTGADYKLKCLKCGRIVLFSSEELKAKIKKTEAK